jgi:hypothetical protein
MSSDILYFCLMGLGWFFLLGWVLALVAACTIAFRQGPSLEGAGSGTRAGLDSVPMDRAQTAAIDGCSRGVVMRSGRISFPSG